MPLYQYTNNDGIKILSDLTWKVTPPNEFNDPFEMSPCVESKDPAGFLQAQVSTWLSSEDFYKKIRGNPRFSQFKTFQDYQRGARPILEGSASRVVGASIDVDEGIQKQILNILSKSLGVICLTKTPKHHLMWAHYADKHKGLVFEFDENHKYFKGEFFKVEYSRDRFVYDPTGADRRSQIEAFVKRKSKEWKYEQEWRLIVGLNQASKVNLSSGQVIYLLKIKPKIIKSVTFGLRTSDDLKMKVKNELSLPHFSHVKLYQIIPSKAQYKLLRQPV